MKKGDKRLEHVERDVHDLHVALVKKIPTHFSMRHVVRSFFGSFTIALIFAFKGLLFEVGLSLSHPRMLLIIITSLLVLSAEIYFVGWERVKNKKERGFSQFWAKRLCAYYLIGIVVSLLVVWLYGLHDLVATGTDVLRLIVAVSLPASLGASAADLFEEHV